MSDSTSTKPYLLRAIYEWCTDNGYTPYLAVHVDDKTVVPREYVKNGEIVLNISALATSRLAMGNEVIEFHARFGGVARAISVPIANVTAIYARENGHGMAFDVSAGQDSGHDRPAAGMPVGLPAPRLAVERPVEQGPAPAGASTQSPPPGPKDDGPKGKPRLKIVK